MHVELLESRRMLSAGQLDGSFGVAGKISFDNRPPADQVAVLPNGKIITVGTRKGEFDVSCFNYDGTLDTAFGNKGSVFTSVGTGDVPSSVVVDNKGRIIVAGTASGIDAGTDFVVLRYTASGALDHTFNSSGIATTSFGGNDVANAVTVSSSDAIYVAGSKLQDNGDRDAAVAKFTAAGQLDSSFGSGGEVLTDLGADDAATAVTVSGNEVVVAGATTGDSESAYAVVCYDGAGNLNTSFNGTGEAFSPLNSTTATVGGVAVLSDQSIVVGGEYNSVGTLFCFTSGGVADDNFGVNGEVDFNGGAGNSPGVSSGINGLTLESDGKILVAGYLDNNGSYSFAVARYTAGGALDSNFGNLNTSKPLLTATFADNSGASSLALSPDGMIVVAGGATELDMARYQSDVFGSDKTGPITVLASPSRVRRATTRAYTITVTYTDNIAVALETLGRGNLLVTGPDGFSELASFLSSTPAVNDPVLVVTYSIAAPSGGFTAATNGVYTTALRKNQIRDTSGNVARAGAIGSFTVRI